MESSVLEAAENKQELMKEQPNSWQWATIQTAPGNENVKLCKVALRAKEPRLDNKLYIEDDLEVEIQFWKLNADMTIQISLLFYDMFNNPLFYAASVYCFQRIFHYLRLFL